MADPSDVIHQIEYRWQHEKDLSPFATTMSEPMTAGWNDLIRAWVRHPHASGLSESVCYKTWNQTGDAALAWRYRDPRAAERADGTSGRPHVSRVLVGHASVLTPEVAIALCIKGLPPSARPHRVSAPDELPIISPEELTAAVNDVAAELDHPAAVAAGLPELVAAALSDRDRPLAVYLPEHLIIRQLKDSPLCRLMWGLHRIMWAVPGAGRRGWSFSTFELPLGAQDAATLPDIVFRQAVHEAAPPGIVRDEVKAWPLDPDAVADLRPQDAGKARWLVEAYTEDGIEGVRRLLADDALDELSDQQTVRLRTSWEQPEDDIGGDLDTGSPAIIVSEASPFVPVWTPLPVDTLTGITPSELAAYERPALHELASPDSVLRRAGQGGHWQPGRLDHMLRQMREAPDPLAVHEILRFIVASRADVGRNDRQEARVERQEARRIMSRDDWYDSVTRSSGYKLGARELADIFQIIVIPDLGKAEDVIERIGGWADGADPEMICGLLMAARDAVLKERMGIMARKSKKDPVEQVRQIMLPRLASRWTHERGIAQWWDIDQLP